ncbi:hypothetical protein [Granulicella arctica]|uniref:Uncharacterized protein n=1 Tax=Granulicella arctica TaxID=940613 RepID=A0A7Y9PGI4_9BACT|nr:hypothetical protein [Granulicella arctica]NYF79427.1 hypothetical protein [Granulicella arctica]
MAFAQSWTVEVLAQPPMIAPARQFTYPLQIAGEEDALARGALLLSVRPKSGGSFLATCALGFTSASMPTGVFACPNPDEMCAVAGGYAYIVDTLAPARCVQIGLKPVVSVLVLEEQGLLLFVGFHSLVAWGIDGQVWQTAKLSWEGVRITEILEDTVVGFGWDLMTDREMEFRVSLKTGTHTGGVR